MHDNGIWLQDLLSVIYGFRNCIRYSLTKERYFILKKHLKILDLGMIVFKSENEPRCLIGSNKITLENAYFQEKNRKHLKIGKALGYPQCCIKFYELLNSLSDAPKFSKLGTKTKLDFRLNYLFNYDTRIYDNEKMKIMRNKYLGWNKYIIPHICCSFDCEKSLQYATKLFNIIENVFPHYANELRFYLKKPILYLDDFSFLPLNGTVIDDNIVYTNVLPMKNLFDEEILKIIQKGNRIKILDNGFSVYNENKKLKIFDLDFEVFNFVDTMEKE